MALRYPIAKFKNGNFDVKNGEQRLEVVLLKIVVSEIVLVEIWDS
jgi:hypothetical protein